MKTSTQILSALATITARALANPMLFATGETAFRGSRGSRQQAMVLLVLAGLLSQFCAGCIIVPIAGSGRKVTAEWKEQASKLQAARATREQVTCQLGSSPAWDFPDLQVIGYKWEVVEWSVFWLAGGGYSADCGICELPSHRLLWLAFDDEDRLLHSQVVSRSESKTGWEQALRWRRRLDPPLAASPPTRFAPLLPPADKAVVHLFWAKGTSYAPVGSVLIDGQALAEIRKGCFTTFVLEPGHHQLALLDGRLELDLAANEVYFLDFHPNRSGSTAEQTLFKCSETEALPRLQKLQYCQ